MDFRARFAPDVPVLIVRESVDEKVIAEALALGAQDAVTLTNVPRLQLVVGRELRTYRLDRALSTTLASAREAKKQLQHIVEGRLTRSRWCRKASSSMRTRPGSRSSATRIPRKSSARP